MRRRLSLRLGLLARAPVFVALCALALAAVAGEPAGPSATPRVFFDHVRHAPHVGDCSTCHRYAAVETAGGAEVSARQFELPAESDCVRCHPFVKPAAEERAGRADPEVCGLCHPLGGDGRVALPAVLPRWPALAFQHRRHEERSGAACVACHDAAQVESGAPPRMERCMVCHVDALDRGCARCHLHDGRGRLVTERRGRPRLIPPAWMGRIAHDADFATTHAGVARARKAVCAACHEDTFCQGCHLGEALERRFHPAGWTATHGAAQRSGALDCATCHREQEVCLTCHRRAGVAADSPRIGGAVPRGLSFHGGAWARRPELHARDARRNLSSCVSCHSARDCLVCHATQASPHGPGFRARCAALVDLAPETCLLCHARTPRCP